MRNLEGKMKEGGGGEGKQLRREVKGGSGLEKEKREGQRWRESRS